MSVLDRVGYRHIADAAPWALSLRVATEWIKGFRGFVLSGLIDPDLRVHLIVRAATDTHNATVKWLVAFDPVVAGRRSPPSAVYSAATGEATSRLRSREPAPRPRGKDY